MQSFQDFIFSRSLCPVCVSVQLEFVEPVQIRAMISRNARARAPDDPKRRRDMGKMVGLRLVGESDMYGSAVVLHFCGP